MDKSILFIPPLSAEVPAVKDCSQVHALGFKQDGPFYLDPTGANNLSLAKGLQCWEDGWTVILQRGQHGYGEEVNYFTKCTFLTF